MNPDFNLHYDRLRENDPTRPVGVGENVETVIYYDAPGHARNLCLVWPDGRRQFVNYAYLVGGTFTPGEVTNEITLTFSDIVLKLHGYGLETLFAALLNLQPKQLVVSDGRYNSADIQVVITDAVFIKID